MANSLGECNKIPWIHLLFRGDSSEVAKQPDEYEQLFKARGGISATIPILEFNYQNIEILGQLICDMAEKSRAKKTIVNGLIMTSPRVVEAMKKALEATGARDAIIETIHEDHVYVVGQTTLKACETKLGILPNADSAKSGNSRNLIDFIKDNSCRLPGEVKLNLLYPKGSLTDNSFEEAFSHRESISILPVVVYRTSVTRDLARFVQERIQMIQTEDLINDSRKLVFNLVFFSPSGVKGHLETKEDFLSSIRGVFPGIEIELQYSSIGKTTQMSLEQNGLSVFCSSEQPTAISLADCIQLKMDSLARESGATK